MMHNTVKRVPINTAREVNRWIFESTCHRLEELAEAEPHAIDKRLCELDREWDVERLLETNAATAVMVGTWLGATVDRRCFAIPAVVGGFLMLHALSGWCPPLPILRRLGVRTSREIEYERNALKAMRGDFVGMAQLPFEMVLKMGEPSHGLRAMQAAIR